MVLVIDQFVYVMWSTFFPEAHSVGINTIFSFEKQSSYDTSFLNYHDDQF